MRNDHSSDSPRKNWRVVRYLFIAVAFLLIVWCIGVKWYAGMLLDDEKNAWSSSAAGSLESFPSKYPRASTNASALRLEELSKPLGIEAAPRSAPKNRQPSAAQMSESEPFIKAVSNYVATDLMSASIQKPSAEITAFLDEHALEINAMRDHILTAELPRWDLDPGEGRDAPIPNLAGAMNIHALLVVNAISEQLHGDSGAAWKNLEASWKLAKSNWERPEVYCNLIALRLTRNSDLAVRHMTAPVPRWRSEMTSFDLVGPFIASMKGDSYLLSRGDLAEMMYDSSSDANDVRWWQWGVLRPLARPYIDLQLPEALASNRELITKVRSTPLCDFDDDSAWVARVAETSTRNVVVETFVPLVPWKQLVAARLGIELTERVLRVKTLRAASRRDTWPPATEIPDIARSSCRGRSWLYTTVEGSMSIKPSSPVIGVPTLASAARDTRAPQPFEYRYDSVIAPERNTQ